MWYLISCYLTGHDYSVCCEGGSIFLRCVNCGRRSHGWDVRNGTHAHAHESHTHETATTR
jgi:hypothetical protein